VLAVLLVRDWVAIATRAFEWLRIIPRIGAAQSPVESELAAS
jgi:hypothetical protein